MLTFWVVKGFFDLFLWWSDLSEGNFGFAWFSVALVASDLLLIGVNLPKWGER